MITKILPDYPYNVERARILSGLLLNDANEPLPRYEAKEVLASLLVQIVNSRPDNPWWSWPELGDAITAVIDGGERDPDTWFDFLHQPGLEGAAEAVDGAECPRSTAGYVRSTAIRTVALPTIRALSKMMED